ncbi:hypothetical protein SNEBB_011388 [Seison nebaliae]|nr:hypothetical protein SNEBB_011388 [Seison nebaliae]
MFSANQILKLNHGDIRPFLLRLKPGTNVLDSIEEFMKCERAVCASIVTVVGSVSNIVLRFAGNRSDGMTIHRFGNDEKNETYEVIAMSGFFTPRSDPKCHIHCSISDKNGKMVGGHVMADMIVHTTLEIELHLMSDIYNIKREYCPMSTFNEMTFKQNNS